MPLETLTIEVFRRRLNETFQLAGPRSVLDLVLAEVEDIGDGYSRRAFSLLFTAPPQPVMPQATYRLDNPATGPLDIFLVPLGPKDGVFRYQAVFT